MRVYGEIKYEYKGNLRQLEERKEGTERAKTEKRNKESLLTFVSAVKYRRKKMPRLGTSAWQI